MPRDRSHLKEPWKKGQSGNPSGKGGEKGGRPVKGQTYSELYAKWNRVKLSDLPKTKEETEKWLQQFTIKEAAVIQRVLRGMRKGGDELDRVIERTEGIVKPPPTLEGNPFADTIHEVVYGSDEDGE